MNLRRATRYRVGAPAFFWWENSEGTLQHGKGTTRDISITSAFIVADCVPARGCHIEIDVYLPAEQGVVRFPQLHGEGRVLRVDMGEGAPTGFAAEVVFQTERSADPVIFTDHETQ